MTTVEILTEAKKLVEKGWLQGFGSGANDRYCAGAAIEVAASDRNDDRRWSAKAIFAKAVGIAGPICNWNDIPGRTQAEVVAAFTKAIELAKAQP